MLPSVICYLSFVIVHAFLLHAFDLSRNVACAHLPHLEPSFPGGPSRTITLSVVIAILILISITGSLAPPTPISLAKIPSETQSAFGELRQIEEGASKDKATLASTTSSLANLTTELRARMLEDNIILAGNPSLDLLYRLRTTWQTYSEELSKAEQDLAQRESNLESQITRLSQMNQIWQATLQSAPQADMPAAVLHQVQAVLDEITKSRRAAEADRATVLTLQSDVLLR